MQGRGRAGLGQREGNRGKCELRKGTCKGKRYMQPHQKHILWPQKHTESQVPSCILRAKKEPGSQPLQAGKIKIKTKDYLACPLMTGLITDLEDVFRSSLPPALTPTAHSVSTVTSSSPLKTRPNPSLPISLLWGFKGPNSCQSPDTGLLQSQTLRSREETVLKQGGGEKKSQTNPKQKTTTQQKPNKPTQETH